MATQTPEKVAIASITIHENDTENYISYSDTDISTDYFHSYSLNTKRTIEWLNRDNSIPHRVAECIQVNFDNNCQNNGYKRCLKVLNQICAACNYSQEMKKDLIDGKGREFCLIRYKGAPQ